VLTVVAGVVLYGAGIAAISPASLPVPAPSAPTLLTADLPQPEISSFIPVPEAKPRLLAVAEPRPTDVSSRDLTCLAQAVYYEARGEGRDGQRAVAEVVLRRVVDGRYPRTICGVVYQDAGSPGCQFSFACGRQNRRIDWHSWKSALDVANYELNGPGRHEDLTLGATHFHTTAVTPSWSRRFPRTTQIGTHVFYRQPGGSYDSARARGATS
jgi:spore germination cell wall hydrolase CwlJ-like protein